MVKMTLSALSTFVQKYVDATKQAGAWNKTANNFIGLVDKIGKLITIDGNYNDKLTMFDGDELPLGKTIEEYFIDLTLPEAYDTITSEGAKNNTPALPSVENVTYSYSLGRTKLKTTEPYDNFERACLTGENAGSITGDIIEKFTNSYTLYKYNVKKQGIANLIAKANTASTANLVTAIAVPSDTETSEAFIKEIKARVEDASFATEKNNLGQYLIGAAPELVLLVKKGVMPTVEVDAISGAFQKEALALPAKVIVVDDFGNDSTGAYAVLLDPRGFKLHQGYNAIRTAENADGDFVNFVRHSEHTLFISKSTYVHVFKAE